MQFGQMRRARQTALLGMALALFASPALANPTLVIDANSGQVLIESQPTANWYPASLTKLMTVYVALQAVRAGRMTMDTPFVVSAARGQHAGLENGLSARHSGDARQCAENADGQIAQRHRRDGGGRASRARSRRSPTK